MADNSAAKKEEEVQTPTTERKTTSEAPQKPVLLLLVVVINMLVMISVAMILWTSYKAEKAKPKLQDIVAGEQQDMNKKAADVDAGEDVVGKLVPMETFLVNLAGTRGNKLVKIDMELEVDGPKVVDELDKRKPQMRDIIIILLSSKTYDQVTTREGKENLRTEVKETINSFLGKGKIKKVYFTNFIIN
jgi:flagellar FliL protein